MFFKNSRYGKESFSVTLDAGGRKLKSVNLRATPAVDGTFLHTVEDGDRLDHLAYKYYKAPEKWWRIVDADQEHFFPLDLLSTGVICSMRIPLVFSDDESAPPWSDLARQLSDMVGVCDFRFEENVRLVEDMHEIEGEMISIGVEYYERALLVQYNSLNLEEDDLTAIVTSSGFEAGAAQTLGRAGKKIVIPPDGM